MHFFDIELNFVWQENSEYLYLNFYHTKQTILTGLEEITQIIFLQHKLLLLTSAKLFSYNTFKPCKSVEEIL